MTESVARQFIFSRKKGRDLIVDFKGGELSSDGGLLLLDALEKKTGLLKKAAALFSQYDKRCPFRIEHSMFSMLRQRVFGIALGYEDGNDHEVLRKDPLFSGLLAGDKASNKEGNLASPSTLSRQSNFLKSYSKKEKEKFFFSINELFVSEFIASYKKAPKEIVLDFDATDSVLHGDQEEKFFHGYYDHYCYLPLYVYCGKQLLSAYLRPANIDGAKHSWAILSLLVKRLKKAFPETRLIFRGDSGFCRWKMLRWMDNHDVSYVIGISKNKRLCALAKDLHKTAKENFEATKEKQRLFSKLTYAAKTWDKERMIIAKAEYNSKGENNRYVVSNLDFETPEALYDFYTQRGDMENRIKETQLYLFADRMSCSDFHANFLRLLLSSLAYILLDTLRRTTLKATPLENAYVSSLRNKLLKIGAQVKLSVRRFRVSLASNFPLQNLFALVHKRLACS